MTCPDKLHIPYKKWALGGGVANGQQEDQNLLAIERWANRLPCSEGTPRAWCDSDQATLAPGDTLTVDTPISTDAEQVMVHVTIVATNPSEDPETLSLFGYFRVNGQDMNSTSGFADTGWTWPAYASRTITASCLVDAGGSSGSNGASVTSDGASTGDLVVRVSVQVVEVDGQSASCCIQGG